MKLSEIHLQKLSGYLMDVSKMLIGATFVSVFAPNFIGEINIFTFIAGIIIAIILIVISLKLIPTTNK